MDDLEEDPAYRQNINIYKNVKKVIVDVEDSSEVDDPNYPKINLSEMLDDLHIGDGDDMETENNC